MADDIKNPSSINIYFFKILAFESVKNFIAINAPKESPTIKVDETQLKDCILLPNIIEKYLSQMT